MTTWINVPFVEDQDTNFGYYNVDHISAIAVNTAPSPDTGWAVFIFTTPVELASAPALAEPQYCYLFATQEEAQAKADALAAATGIVVS